MVRMKVEVWLVRIWPTLLLPIPWIALRTWAQGHQRLFGDPPATVDASGPVWTTIIVTTALTILAVKTADSVRKVVSVLATLNALICLLTVLIATMWVSGVYA